MPFALEQFEAVLRLRRESGEPHLLIGGQAVYFWASRYLAQEPCLEQWRPFTSKDIDFQGGRADVVRAAKALGVKARLPDSREMTALAGVIPLEIGEEPTTIEFLSFFPGVKPSDALRLAVEHEFRGCPIRVLDPFPCLLASCISP